jgi:serine/threonine protein kinase
VQILKTLSPYDSNFLTLKEVYEGDNTLYLVTPYLEGYSLTDELEKAKVPKKSSLEFK